MFGFKRKPKKIPPFIPESKAKTCKESHKWHSTRLLFTDSIKGDLDKMTSDEIKEALDAIPLSQICLNCGKLAGKEVVVNESILKTARESFIKGFVEDEKALFYENVLESLTKRVIKTNKDHYPSLSEYQLRNLLERGILLREEASQRTAEELPKIYTKALVESFTIREK